MPSKSGWEGKNQRLLGGCGKEVWLGWAEARCWGTSVPQNKSAASLDLKGVSGSHRCLYPSHSGCLCWKTSASPLSHFPDLTLFSMSSDAHSILQSSQAGGWQHWAQTSHLIFHHTSLASSSPKQIQLTNLMLQLQKAKLLWKTDQVPWNSLTERPERPPSRQQGGVEAEQCRQMLANPGCTREPPGSFEKYSPSPQCRCPG